MTTPRRKPPVRGPIEVPEEQITEEELAAAEHGHPHTPGYPQHGHDKAGAAVHQPHHADHDQERHDWDVKDAEERAANAAAFESPASLSAHVAEHLRSEGHTVDQAVHPTRTTLHTLGVRTPDGRRMTVAFDYED